MSNRTPSARAAQIPQSPKCIDRLGDIFASGALAAIPNTTDRINLIFAATYSGSRPTSSRYRKHWYSDGTQAIKCGRDRATINRSHQRLKHLGAVRSSDYKERKGKIRVTELAEFADLATIGQKYSGDQIDIKPAPLPPAGEKYIRFVEEVFESGLLSRLHTSAGEILFLIAWLAQKDPLAPDYGAYTITQAKIAAILYRHEDTIGKALKDLTSASLIARDGKTITLKAYTADQFASCRPSSSERSFDDETKGRCQRARQKSGAVVTPHPARSSHPTRRGRHTNQYRTTTNNHYREPYRGIRKRPGQCQEGQRPQQRRRDDGLSPSHQA